jgi:hypothetical protein
MKKHAIATIEILNRRRLARRNFLTELLGGNEQNRRKEVSNLKDTEYLTRHEPDGDGRLERSYPHFFHRIYSKGPRADKALKAAGIEPIRHPDAGEQFWHQLFIDDILLSFEIACKERGILFRDQFEILGDRPAELPCNISFTFPSTGKTHTSDKALAPDALFAIGDTYFALEADRGTEPIERSNLNQTSYLRKFLQYRDVLKGRTYKAVWDIPNLMVLHISARQERTDRLKDFLANGLRGKSESQCFRSAPTLASTAKSPMPLKTLLTDPYDRVGHPPYIIGERNGRHQ